MLAVLVALQQAHVPSCVKDFDKKLSHVNRGAAATKPVDGAGGAAGLDTMAEDRVHRML